MTQAATAPGDLTPPAVKVETPIDAPVKAIKPDELRSLGQKLDGLFKSYVSDRRIAELRWLRNQRQYLGIYDPEIDKELSPSRSRVYPRLTRIKVVSVVSRIMNLMFPGNDKNWALKASPSPDMSPDDIKQAVQDALKRDQAAGVQPQVDKDYALAAIQTLADTRADALTQLVEDQLEEIGGDQSLDYVALNRKALMSGAMYGPGLLVGPYAREVKSTAWQIEPMSGQPMPMDKIAYKPVFEFLPIWDWYPDLSAKTLDSADGYFERKVMSRSQVRELADRSDFFADVIKKYLTGSGKTGNYKPQPFEQDLRSMGVKVNVNEVKSETAKYEVIIWHGPVSGDFLSSAGVDVADDKMADEIDAEVWMIDQNVIKAAMNPWKELGVDVKTLHTFLFDEDDTSPIGQGLPNIMRDSQMSVCAAARMMMDNASIICGPNLEVNTTLLRPDQDLTSIVAYRNWYRDDDGPTAQWAAVRNIEIDSHLNELQQIIDLWLKFADAETFVGPATGGDMAQTPSEPMRTAAGASMMRGDAALPFKDIIRSFDRFTQSIIQSLVQFNRKFNPDLAPEGDYNVIARGATSLMAKEVRGMQVDQLAQSLTPEEKQHVDMRKFAGERFKVRDLGDLLLSEADAERGIQAANQAQQAQQDQQTKMVDAQIQKVLAEVKKDLAQAQKSAAAADAHTVETGLSIVGTGVDHALAQPGGMDGGQSGSNGQPVRGSGPGAGLV
jgi:hypothetical protein